MNILSSIKAFAVACLIGLAACTQQPQQVIHAKHVHVTQPGHMQVYAQTQPDNTFLYWYLLTQGNHSYYYWTTSYITDYRSLPMQQVTPENPLPPAAAQTQATSTAVDDVLVAEEAEPANVITDEQIAEMQADEAADIAAEQHADEAAEAAEVSNTSEASSSESSSSDSGSSSSDSGSSGGDSGGSSSSD